MELTATINNGISKTIQIDIEIKSCYEGGIITNPSFGDSSYELGSSTLRVQYPTFTFNKVCSGMQWDYQILPSQPTFVTSVSNQDYLEVSTSSASDKGIHPLTLQASLNDPVAYATETFNIFIYDKDDINTP